MNAKLHMFKQKGYCTEIPENAFTLKTWLHVMWRDRNPQIMNVSLMSGFSLFLSTASILKKQNKDKHILMN